MSVSLGWLLGFIVSEYEQLPDDLNYSVSMETDKLFIWSIESEVDEMWSFVGKKKNKQWIWIVMDARSRQIIAFHVGDRSRESARKLWESIRKNYRGKATFYTDDWQAYKGVIPKERHRVIKGKGNQVVYNILCMEILLVAGCVNSFVYGLFPPKSGLIGTPLLSPENG